jgi:hypothetical protein
MGAAIQAGAGPAAMFHEIVSRLRAVSIALFLQFLCAVQAGSSTVLRTMFHASGGQFALVQGTY